METKGSYCVHWSMNQINLAHTVAPDILAIKVLSTSYIFTHFYGVYGDTSAQKTMQPTWRENYNTDGYTMSTNNIVTEDLTSLGQDSVICTVTQYELDGLGI
jgi:hypothetical protein